MILKKPQTYKPDSVPPVLRRDSSAIYLAQPVARRVCSAYPPC